MERDSVIWCCLVVVTMGVLTASCSSTFDARAEQAVLLQRDAAWSAAAYEGKDAETILSYWADDAIVVPAGQPTATGKTAIRAFVTSALKTSGFKIRWTSAPPTFSHDGTLAYMQSATETTISGPNGAPLVMHSRGLTVWRKDADGQWRCVVDTWNEGGAE